MIAMRALGIGACTCAGNSQSPERQDLRCAADHRARSVGYPVRGALLPDNLMETRMEPPAVAGIFCDMFKCRWSLLYTDNVFHDVFVYCLDLDWYRYRAPKMKH